MISDPPNHDVAADTVADPLPDPEPIAPSLSEPDPGVFHHTPTDAPNEKSA
jgi:hypothetical protein